jgi:hypothetical protein
MAWAEVAMTKAKVATAINLIISFLPCLSVIDMLINRSAVIAARQACVMRSAENERSKEPYRGKIFWNFDSVLRCKWLDPMPWWARSLLLCIRSMGRTICTNPNAPQNWNSLCISL